MKKALTIMVVLLIPVITMAENPDSRISITFNVGVLSQSFSDKLYTMPKILSQKGYSNHFEFGANLKLPSSENVTFNLSLNLARGDIERKRNYYFFKSRSSYNAYQFNLGLTLYIGQSINK